MRSSETTSDSECNGLKKKINRELKSDKKNYDVFHDHWLERYQPWLSRDTSNPEKPYCKACRRTLGCRKFDLGKHERTTKHINRLTNYRRENNLPPIPPVHQNLGQRKERKSRGTIPKTYAVDNHFESVLVKTTPHYEEKFNSESEENNGNDLNILKATTFRRNNPGADKITKAGNDSKKLLLQIQKDKFDLMSILSDVVTPAPVIEKDHLDSFFDSICASLKGLSPKLKVEAKMRICQLICELELREIAANNLEEIQMPADTDADAEETVLEEHKTKNPNKQETANRKIPHKREESFGRRRKVIKSQAKNSMPSFNKLNTKAPIEEAMKDHIDSFCESVCSSVKLLSPMLVAEAKLRISQLISEFELRAITDDPLRDPAVSETNGTVQR